ncbi:hypothetical protein KJ885_03565 [Patescibacteria group bacterium]|nr:hypothetical protein [Patescibacteria group bacterium]
MYLILAFIVGVGLNAGATILFKLGANHFPTGFSWESVWLVLKNYYLWGGFLLYAISTPPYLYIFSKMKVSIAYPSFVSLAFAATVILAMLFLKENLTILQIIGLVLVVGGIVLLATNGGQA